MAGKEDVTLDVKIEAELSSSLSESLSKATELGKQVPLNKKDKENYDSALKRAQLSLGIGDLKGFQQSFNTIVDILRKASTSTGKLNDQITEYTRKIEELNKKVNARKDRLTDIETKYYSADAKKAGLLKDQEVTKIKDSYGDIAKNITIKQIRELITQGFNGKPLKDINLQQKLPDNLGMSSRDEAKALVKIARDTVALDKSYKREKEQLGNENTADVQEIQKLEDEIKRIQEAAPAAASELEKVYVALSKLKNETNQTITDQRNASKIQTSKKEEEKEVIVSDNTETFQKQSNSIGKLVKNITIYHLALRAVRTTLRSTIHTIKELDKQLTEQAMVTGRTRRETYQLLNGYQQLAISLGATTKEVAQVATEYMRQGKTTEQALTLTKAAISAAKVASINTSESVDYLTTALNGFRLSAEDAMKVSDKFAAVAASAAVSYEEIATALSKVAAQANLAGMSIDYTTAILAKGIETTREAPETIGTALKTVIARMREIKDYGETLGGDTDLNNVENQLAYVGIELKANNGELRSTEDVLDELGKKWDTLNSNQQAAIAKALAGTRQQSRLIAMMSDYERVIELQEIAERSQGATMAQMETYTQGMEAAMNKVAVSWEKIVTTATNSEVLIGIVNAFANILNIINEIMSHTGVMIASVTIITALALKHLGIKAKERIQQERLARLSREEHRIAQKQVVEEKKRSLEKTVQYKYTLLSKKADGTITKEEEARLATIDQTIAMKQEELALAKQDLNYLENAETLGGSLKNNIADIGTGLLGMIAPLGMILTSLWKIVLARKASAAAAANETKEDIKDNAAMAAKEAEAKTNAAYKMASSAAAIPVAGWVIAAAILAALIGVTIAGAVGSFSSATEKTSEKVDALSNEIYRLQKTKTALDTVISKFDAIDEKVIKTTEDLKTMKETLEQAADSLSDEAGKSVLDWLNGEGKKHKGAISEKDYYSNLQSDRARREFLEEESAALQKKLKEDRNKQIKIIQDASAASRRAFFTEAQYANVRDAIYALNNAKLNETIELEEEAGRVTTEHASNIRKFTQALLENVSAETAWSYAQNPTKIENITHALQDLQTTIEDSKSTNSIDVLGNSTYSLRDQVKAYRDIADAIYQDTEAYKSFVQEYSAFDVYLQLSESVLDFIDAANISVDKLNDIYTAYRKLQAAGVEITKEDFQGRFQDFLTNLATFNGDAKKAINATFNDLIQSSDSPTETFSILVNTFSNILETGLLNMGQNITTFKNTTNAFYEKAQKWATMSDADKSAFIADYNDLFSDVAGEDLKNALEAGNFAAMEQALKDNKTFQEQRMRLLTQVEEELKWELAKEGEDYNAAYVEQLKQAKAFLSDLDKVYKADLSWRLEQEQKALDAYKELLQKQADAQTEALEKQRDAYQKYFDDIKQAEEDQNYEEDAGLLITNLSKLGASTNADAVKQASELQEQLEELEKERLQELQDRAQEQILQNLDDEINKISTQLEDIINNQQALLVSMNEKMSNPSEFVSELLSNKMATEGLTQLGFQDYMNTLKETFAPFMDFDWNALNGNIENNESQSLILNINGGTYELSQDEQQSLFDTILAALQQMGIR